MPKHRAIWIFLAILLMYPVSYMVIITTKEPHWDVHSMSGLAAPPYAEELEWQPFSYFVDNSPFNKLCRTLYTPLIKLDRLIWHPNKTITTDRRNQPTK